MFKKIVLFYLKLLKNICRQYFLIQYFECPLQIITQSNRKFINLSIGTNMLLKRCSFVSVWFVLLHVQVWFELNPVVSECVPSCQRISRLLCVSSYMCRSPLCVCVCVLSEVTYRVKGDALDSGALLWQVCLSCICTSTTRPCLQQDVSL